MKVVLVAEGIYPIRGGVELHVYNLAQGLRAAGDAVRVYVRRGPPKESLDGDIPVTWGCSLAELYKGLRCSPPDVLHGHGSRSPFVAGALLVARRLGVKAILTPHCFYPAQDWVGAIKRLAFDPTLGKAALRGADHIICLTENDQRDAVRLGAILHRTRIIPNSIRMPSPLPPQQVTAWKQSRGLGSFLLSVGRLDRVKRGDFLIRALPHLSRQDLQLIFIGPDAGCRRPWERIARQGGVHDRIQFWGEVSDEELRAAYQGCSLFVLASAYEGLPTVLLEAMALGAVVAASDAGGCRYLIEPGINGFLFSYADEKRFCAVVQHCLTTDVHAVRENARRIVRERYSWEVALGLIRDLYRPTTQGVRDCVDTGERVAK